MFKRSCPCFFTIIRAASSTAGDAPFGRVVPISCEIRLRLGSLLEGNLPAFLLQRIYNQSLIAELIGDGSIARDALQQGFQCFGVPPCKQAIQIANLAVEFVVSLRADHDNAVRADRANIRGHFEDAAVGDFLAVSYLHEAEFALRRRVDKDGSDDQGTEVISLAGFVDADAFDGTVRRGFSHRQVSLVENLRAAG